MGAVLDTVGKLIAGYLQKECRAMSRSRRATRAFARHYRAGRCPADRGHNRISGIINISRSPPGRMRRFCRPDRRRGGANGEPHVLIEANIGEGVTSAPLSKYFPYHTRLCRPVGLSFEDRTTVCRYAINRIGFGYDTKNILDLMRYLFPLPIPQRWRRRMIAFGSGDPTRSSARR
jgi:hypothetical protein